MRSCESADRATNTDRPMAPSQKIKFTHTHTMANQFLGRYKDVHEERRLDYGLTKNQQNNTTQYNTTHIYTHTPNQTAHFIIFWAGVEMFKKRDAWTTA